MDDEQIALDELRTAIAVVEDDNWRWCQECNSNVDIRDKAALVALCIRGERCQQKPKQTRRWE